MELHLPTGETIAPLSKKKREEIQKWVEKGYQVQSATINYIVAWKGKDEVEEAAVLLPELVLQKREIF